MAIRVFLGLIFFLGLMACNNKCDENAPRPLSFNLQWVDAKGNDLYKTKVFKTDSLKGFYKKRRSIDSMKMTIHRQKNDTNQYYVNVMPLLRRAFELQLDTVFLRPNKTDYDTIVAKIVKREIECFSSVYEFEKLEYNGKPLNGKDILYKIEKRNDDRN